MQHFEFVKNTLKQHQYTWLITGVAGFIGSNLLETLLTLNQKVVGLDNFSTGFQKNLDDVLSTVKNSNNFTFHEGDIRRLDDCKKATQGVDFVLHQAALGSVPRSINTPEITNETNVSGFVNILIAAKENKVKRFIYASSSSVYGDSSVLPKTETHIGNPLSPYAVSKYTNELYAKAFSNCYGMANIGLRYFNIFGPRQNPKGAYAAVIPLWISAFLDDSDIYINGDGKTSRDFCYVENAIQANLLAACTDNPECLNRVYNVTIGHQTTLQELFELIRNEFGNKRKTPIYRDFRNGDIRHSLADITQAQHLLQYYPTHSVDQGLKETVKWFCQKARTRQ